MQPLALTRQQISADSLTDEVVPEPVPVTGCDQLLAFDQLTQRKVEIGIRAVGEACQKLMPDARAGDRGDAEHVPGRIREAGHSLEE